MDWFMRLREAPADAELLSQWEAWLQASDAHSAAWMRICRTWAALGERPESAHGKAALPPRDAMPPRRLSRRRFGIATAALLSAGLIAAVFGPVLQLRLQADVVTGTGETREVMLPDGSKVTLAPETALANDFNGSARHVRVLSGEAYFEVERDTARPFVVETQDAAVRVLGTVFSVRDTGNGTRVELAHGAVALKVEDPSGDELSLLPGDVVTVDRADHKAELSHIDPADIASWREGRLSVTDQTFGDVVSLIQRQHRAWIVVAQDRLSTRRVTGLYDLTDPDRALDALAAPFGLKVRAVSPYLRIISSF